MDFDSQKRLDKQKYIGKLRPRKRQMCTIKKKEFASLMKLLIDFTDDHERCNIITNNIPQECRSLYKPQKYLGGGEYGHVLSVCKKSPSSGGAFSKSHICRALKILKASERDWAPPKLEFEMQQYAHQKARLAPKIYNVCQGKQVYFVEMGKIDGILEYMFRKKLSRKILDNIINHILKLIKDLAEIKMTHGDFHLGNIGYVIKVVRNKLTFVPQIIDFGQAHVGHAYPDLDLITLLTTMHKDYGIRMNKENRLYMRKKLFEIYKKDFNNKLTFRQSTIEKEYEKLRKMYEEKHF